MDRYVLVFVLLASMGGCASFFKYPLPPKSYAMDYEDVNPWIRNALKLEKGTKLEACGDIVSDTIASDGPSSGEVEVILTDTNSRYYNNKTGRFITESGHWYCSFHNAECARPFALRTGWTCD